VALAGPRELRLILDVAIKLACRCPELAERPVAAAVIPHARRDDTMLARHARHLAQSRDRVCHEVNDELGQGGVERLIAEWELLRRGASHGHPGVALSSCCDEGFRRIDGRHGGGSQSRNQLARQCPRAAADIEHTLTGRDPREIGERWGERHRIPAHESVVRVSPDGEAHERNLSLSAGHPPGGGTTYIFSLFPDWRTDPVHFLQAGDRLFVVLMSGRGTGAASRAPTHLELAEVFELRHGVPVRVREFPTWGEALVAAGMDPPAGRDHSES
jgi:hypothetical protein